MAKYYPIFIYIVPPGIISGQPTVKTGGETATFTITFATIQLVTFDVVSTAVVEINVTAIQGNADPIRETVTFPPNFPRVTTTPILITNLTQGTEYNYTVRVLTTSNYITAMVIPEIVSGTFTMTTQGIYVEIFVCLSQICDLCL